MARPDQSRNCPAFNGHCPVETSASSRIGLHCRGRIMPRMLMPLAKLADGLALTTKQIEQGLRTYPGLPHRMERVREKDGVLFVNDSKATNATATAPALAAFDAVRWILGGQAKSDNLDECAPHFGHVRKAYTIGEAGELFARLLSPHMAVAECGTLDAAVQIRRRRSRSGGHGVAVAGLRFVRPVQGFRGARRPVPRAWWGRYDRDDLGQVEGVATGRSEPLWPLGPVGGRALVLGDRPAAAAADHRADRHRADRGRRRLAGRGAALFGRQRDLLRPALFLSPTGVDRGSAFR